MQEQIKNGKHTTCMQTLKKKKKKERKKERKKRKHPRSSLRMTLFPIRDLEKASKKLESRKGEVAGANLLRSGRHHSNRPLEVVVEKIHQFSLGGT